MRVHKIALRAESVDRCHDSILATLNNIAMAFKSLGRLEEALRLRQEVYARRLKLSGEEHDETIREALCLTNVLVDSSRFEDAKVLMRKMLPVARRVLGESHEVTLKMRWAYARALCMNTDATLDDVREAVDTCEETERTARRVLGGAYPLTEEVGNFLRKARAALAARETPGGA